jgi:hypothetical protein
VISGSHDGKYEDDCLLGYFACSLLEIDRRFGGAFASIIRAMMEAVRTSERSVYFYETTWRNIQEDGNHRLYIHLLLVQIFYY